MEAMKTKKRKFIAHADGFRGQAAVTDALFLLVIISGLTGFLFLFAANYGKGISEQVVRNDSFEFVSSALKTIMYQSVPRNAAELIDVKIPNPDQEVDYLMAMVKEDYADDQVLSDNTKKSLAKSVYAVMRPIADTQDYLFAINTAQKYVLMIVWRTNFEVKTGKDGKPDRFQNVEACSIEKNNCPSPSGPRGPHSMFFCSPDLTTNALQKLFLRVGTTTQAQSLINMVEFSGSSFLLALDTTEIRAGVLLATWTSTFIPDAEWGLLKCSEIDLAGIAA